MIASTRFSRERCTLAVNNERGVALAASVFALAIIGALVASSFFAGRLEQQSGQSIFFAAQAREAAEAGLSEAMAGVTAETLENLAVGGVPLELGTILVGDGVSVRSRVTRLTSRVFLIRAEAQRGNPDRAGFATRSLGLLVQILSAPPAADDSGPATVTRLAERGWVRLY